MHIAIQTKPFDPYLVISNHQKTPTCRHGGTVTFVGTMRDFNEDNAVDSLFLEHYPGMTEKQIQQICEKADEKWGLIDILVIHRVGHINPGEPIVAIGVWAAHRSEAFNACRFIINELKTSAPFWKREQLGSNKKWLSKNTVDNQH